MFAMFHACSVSICLCHLQVVKVPVKHVIMDPQPVHKAGGQVQGKAARMRQLMGAIEVRSLHQHHQDACCI